jgi:hypothetical protein
VLLSRIYGLARAKRNSAEQIRTKRHPQEDPSREARLTDKPVDSLGAFVAIRQSPLQGLVKYLARLDDDFHAVEIDGKRPHKKASVTGARATWIYC